MSVSGSSSHKHVTPDDADNAFARLIESMWYLRLGERHAIACFHDLRPIKQDLLPSCGIVAAAMAASIVGAKVDVPDAVKWARSKRFSNHGEICDAHHLQMLCDEFVKVPSTVIAFPDGDKMLEDLVEGYCFLVPYDAIIEPAGKVGRPAKFGGHNAHWALVFGVLTMRANKHYNLDNLEKVYKDYLVYRKKHKDFSLTADDKPFILAHQGWSLSADLWSLQDLRESCLQLNEVNPKVACDYLVPAGNIKAGLRNKVIRLDVRQKSPNEAE